MTSIQRATAQKTWAVRAGIGSVAALAIVAGGIAVAANASGTSFPLYNEENPDPLYVTEGLVFSKNADLGWIVDSTWTSGKPTGLNLDDIGSMAYSVSSSVSTSTPVAPVAYAPSFQLVVWADRPSTTPQSYGRLVWEPYMQNPVENAEHGEYTDLEDGLWWTSKIAGSAPGSQSDPQPLSFFQTDGGSGWANVHVGAIAVHQGSTTDVTSVVTRVAYDGVNIPLGNADTTPFNQDDIDAATGPLNGQIADLEDDVDGLQGQLADKVDELSAAQTLLGATQAQLGTSQAQLGTALTQYGAAQSALNSYKANHHNVDGTSIGTSRAVLSATPVHGKTVGVKLTGSIAKAASVKYQWYLGGKAVTGATKSTYKVPSNAKGKTVTVVVTGTYKYVAFGVQANTITAR